MTVKKTLKYPAGGDLRAWIGDLKVCSIYPYIHI